MWKHPDTKTLIKYERMATEEVAGDRGRLEPDSE